MAININNITGIKYPLELSNGKVVLSYGVPLIASDIKVLLSWVLGTRFFNGDYGSKLHLVLEEPNDLILLALVNKFIIDAIEQWEPRVQLLDINIFRPDIDKLLVQVRYLIKQINIEDYLTFEYTLK